MNLIDFSEQFVIKSVISIIICLLCFFWRYIINAWRLKNPKRKVFIIRTKTKIGSDQYTTGKIKFINPFYISISGHNNYTNEKNFKIKISQIKGITMCNWKEHEVIMNMYGNENNS